MVSELPSKLFHIGASQSKIFWNLLFWFQIKKSMFLLNLQLFLWQVYIYIYIYIHIYFLGFVKYTYTHSLSHTLSHTTFSLSLSYTSSLSLSLSHTHTHIHTHTHTHTLSLSHAHTLHVFKINTSRDILRMIYHHQFIVFFFSRTEVPLELRRLAITYLSDCKSSQFSMTLLSYLPNPSARAGYDTRSNF